jgi:tetratricopeptide (TPR) repeat protein
MSTTTSDKKEEKSNTVNLAFLIMLKNEEKHVLPTLESGKNVCQEYFYLDTGSTDNTINVVKKWCEDNKKTLHYFSLPFVDFSTNRNYLLDQFLSSSCSHAILVDAGDIMVGSENLIPYLSSNSFDTYKVEQKWEDIEDRISSYYTIRLVSRNPNIEYRGKIHEIIYPKRGKESEVREITCNIPFYLYQDRRLEEADSTKRYARDIEILEQATKEDKTDTRSWYYLANSYYFSEKFDEAIRCYKRRFELGLENKEPRTEEMYQSLLRIAKSFYFLKNMENAIPAFWKAWEYCHEAEAILAISGYYHYVKGDPSTAYALVKLGCAVNKNMDKSFKNENIYNFMRWYELAILSQDSRECYESAEKALIGGRNITDKNKINIMLYIYLYHLNNLMLNFKRYSASNVPASQKKLIVIFGGYSYTKWNGKTVGLGGAESSAVYLAEELVKRNYDVIVCCDTTSPETINGVLYLPIDFYENIVKTYLIHALIVLRYAPFLRSGLNISSHWLWLQDIAPIGEIPIQEINDLSGIVVLSEFHKNKLISLFDPPFKEVVSKKIVVLGNNLRNKTYYDDSVRSSCVKQPLRFIYSSDPSRGLENVVDMFNLLRSEYSHAELHIFSDFTNDYVKSRIDVPKLINKIKTSQGVFNHGRIAQDELAKEMLKSEYWLYTPSAGKFEETYCITALECQACGVKCIVDGSGSLSEVVGERGIIVKDISPNNLLSVIKKEMTKPTINTEKEREWALSQLWENSALVWDKGFEKAERKLPSDLTGFLQYKNFLRNHPFIIPTREMAFWSQFLLLGNTDLACLHLIEQETHLAGENTILLDICSFLGNTSISLSKCVKEVHAFESNKDVLPHLKQNVEGISNIKVHEFDLGEMSVTKKIQEENEQVNERVVESLDELYEKSKGEYIVKISNDKFIKNILLGGKNFIKLNKPLIIIKLSEKEENFDLIRKMGYEMFLLNEGENSQNFACVEKSRLTQFIKKYKSNITTCETEYTLCKNITNGVINMISF